MNRGARARQALIGLALASLPLGSSGQVAAPECVVPAKPGGGFELTCRLLQAGLQRTALAGAPLRITHLPGGVGAVAYEAIVTQRPDEGGTVVAFSSGSLLNLAQGKFGKRTEHDVRWLAGFALDYGIVAVKADSPLQSLGGLLEALRADPRRVVFGVGGTLGGQDWVKAALLAKTARIDPKVIRYVSFEGGGEAFVALRGGHVQVVTGDLGEAIERLRDRQIRLLAVLSDRRLPGRLADLPTAREQGVAVTWPIVRGVYLGPKVAGADFAWWRRAFEQMLTSAEFQRLREELGLLPLALTGPELEAFVKNTISGYGELAAELGLKRR